MYIYEKWEVSEISDNDDQRSVVQCKASCIVLTRKILKCPSIPQKAQSKKNP